MSHILIVDDDAATRRLHAFLLTNAGYRVTEAADGIESLQKVAREEFDLIVTDISTLSVR